MVFGFRKINLLREKIIIALLKMEGGLRDREYYDYPFLKEVFIEQAYSRLYLSIKPNTIVLDIGANIGDTAIYFAMNPNVKKVYAYEPVPTTYEAAKENVGKTPFSKKIILKNTGIVRNGRIAHMKSEFFRDTNVGEELSEAESTNGKKIRLLSLNEVLKGKKKVVIKCDIEGGEAKIFKNADLSNVYAIELEYHLCKEIVKSDLQEQFDVIDLHPQQRYGMIFAIKKLRK